MAIEMEMEMEIAAAAAVAVVSIFQCLFSLYVFAFDYIYCLFRCFSCFNIYFCLYFAMSVMAVPITLLEAV